MSCVEHYSFWVTREITYSQKFAKKNHKKENKQREEYWVHPLWPPTALLGVGKKKIFQLISKHCFLTLYPRKSRYSSRGVTSIGRPLTKSVRIWKHEYKLIVNANQLPAAGKQQEDNLLIGLWLWAAVFHRLQLRIPPDSSSSFGCCQHIAGQATGRERMAPASSCSKETNATNLTTSLFVHANHSQSMFAQTKQKRAADVADSG